MLLIGKEYKMSMIVSKGLGSLDDILTKGFEYHYIMTLELLIEYFDGLSSDHEICTAFGSSFTKSTNLFGGIEPETAINCLTIIPYGGPPVNIDGMRWSPNVQIRIKSSNNSVALKTMKSIINTLHQNTSIIKRGVIITKQTNPIVLGRREVGEYIILVCNFSIKHAKMI